MDNNFLLHIVVSEHQLKANEGANFLDKAHLLAAVLIVGSNEVHA